MSEEVIEAPVATAAPEATDAPSVVADAPAALAADPPASKWSNTWREDMAGELTDTATPEERAEHTKLMVRLKRLNTPGDVAKAIREQDKLISSGELKRTLPKTPTDAQVAEFRKSNGIPESAEKYDMGVPDNVELTDLDNTMLSGWAAKAHAVNATPEQVKAGTAAYLETRAKVAEAMETANTAAKSGTIEELRAEWGADYLSNTQGLSSMLGQFDSEASGAILSARTADGIQLLNIPSVVRALAGHARDLGYVGATVVPQGGDLGKGIDDEVAAIEKSMFNEDGTKSPAYWKSEKAQSRYSQLLETQSRRGAKA